MTIPTGTAITVPGVTGNTAYAPIDMDAVDKAAIVVPGLIAFARAKKLKAATVNSGFTDRAMNAVTVAGITKTFSDALAALNGKPAVTLSGATGAAPYRPAFILPASFTFMAVVNFGTLKDGDNILNDAASSSGFRFLADSQGRLTVDPDGTGTGSAAYATATGQVASNGSYLLGVSHDAPNKRSRIFLGSAVPLLTADSPVAYAGGQNPLPFGVGASGSSSFNFAGSWAMWAFFDRAYGAGGNDDALFAAFAAAAKVNWAV